MEKKKNAEQRQKGKESQDRMITMDTVVDSPVLILPWWLVKAFCDHSTIISLPMNNSGIGKWYEPVESKRFIQG